METDQTECSETYVYKIQTPGNYPEESIQYSEHGEIFKSRDHVSVKYAVSRDTATQFRNESFSVLHRNLKHLEIFQRKFL